MRFRVPAALILAVPAAAAAQIPARAGELIALLNGGGSMAESFTPAFIADVPEARLRGIAAQLVAQNGRAKSVVRAVPDGTGSLELTVAYARADVIMTLTLEPAPPGRIAGLIITGGSARLATIDAVLAQLRALPGSAGAAVARLGEGAPQPLAQLAADRPLAIGSTFKLLVLAELLRTIEAGERHWSDVVPLAIRSVPSGILQDWPQDAPLTLHTLATLMISRSDNSATDTLLALLGRERVVAMAGPLGWDARSGNDPLLSTLEMAKLKGAEGGELGARYATLDAAGRRALLAGPVAALPRTAIDYAALATRPQRIDTIEWFASPDELVRTLDWFRRASLSPDGAVAAAILAVAPGLSPVEARQFGYVGYKGGSEAGVLSMSYLIRTRRDHWYAISGSWNDPAAPLAEKSFFGLISRLVQLVELEDRAR